jgi:hypothetical protein
MNTQTVSAVFDSYDEAERAISELRRAGVRENALSVIAQRNGKMTETSDGHTTEHDEHGSIIRGLIGGGALGAGLGVAALAIPGVGPLAAVGAIAASAVPEAIGIGAAVGAAAGGLNEALHKHGVSKEDADYYGERLKQGGIFVSVDTRDAGITRELAEDTLYRNGGHSSTRSRMAAAH